MPYYALLWQLSLVVGQIDPLRTGVLANQATSPIFLFAERQNNLLPLF